MKRSFSFWAVVLVAAAVLSGCGGNDTTPVAGLNPTPVLGTLITAPTVSPITSFGQSIASSDTGTVNSGTYDSIPGQPNVWDIFSDFSLDDGNDDQVDGALELTVGTTAFPSNQTYSELTFYTPTMGSADGVKVAAVSDGAPMLASALTGTYSAFLNTTSDSRLQQTVDLTGTTVPIVLEWNDNAYLYGGDIAGFTPRYRVVVRDLLGAELVTLSTTTAIGSNFSSQALFLNDYAGQQIVLSFEAANIQEASDASGLHRTVIIDDVSIRDINGTGAERITNGTFETGDMTGWRTNSPAEVQNLTSGARTIGGLSVKRSFYTVPNKLWGRWVDVFENTTVSAVTTTVTYHTNLGSDTCGVIYDTPGTSSKAITSWDTTWEDRDIAMVFGLVSSKTYTSTTVLSPPGSAVACTGNENIYVDHVITVPAGGRKALVNFIVLGGHDTGLTATAVTDKATEVDAEAGRIVSNFWADGQYRTGMTQAQIDAISNF